MSPGHQWRSLLAVLALFLASANPNRLEDGLTIKTPPITNTADQWTIATQKWNRLADQRPVPQNELKFKVKKATWTDAKAACAADGAALYTVNNSAQLNSAMLNFSLPHSPWVDMNKTGANNGSTECSFLNASASGRINIYFDDCLALHGFICQKPTSKSKTFIKQTSKADTVIAPRALTTLYDFLDAFATQCQFMGNIFEPRIASALLQSTSLTPAEIFEITAMGTGSHAFSFVAIPGINLMISSPFPLLQLQIQSIQVAATEGVNLFTSMQIITSAYASQLNLNAVQTQLIVDVAAQAVSFYNVIADVVANDLVQPVVTAEQVSQLQAIITQTQILLDGAANAFAATPYAELAQMIQTHLTINQDYFSLTQPLLANALTQTNLLTPEQLALLQSVAGQTQSVFAVSIPGIIALLSSTQSLSPLQIQQVQTALAENSGLLDISNQVTTALSPMLGISTEFQQAVSDFILSDQGFLTALQILFSDPLVEPTITPEQIQQLQDSLSEGQGLLTAAGNLIDGATTPAPPLPTIAELLQDYHALTQVSFGLMQPMLLAAASQSNVLTPEQVQLIQDVATQSALSTSNAIPDLISLLTTTPTLSPLQIGQAQATLTEGVALIAMSNTITNILAPLLNIDPFVQQAVGELNTQCLAFLGALQAVFINPFSQPTLTAAQALELQNVLAQLQIPIDSLNNYFSTTTTPAPPPSPLSQALEALLAQVVGAYSFFGPVIGGVNPAALTPTEAAQLEAIRTQTQNLISVKFPSVIAMLATNPTLTPEQVQQVKDVLAQRITTLTAASCVVSSLSEDLGWNAAQLLASEVLGTEVIALYGAVLTAVSDTSVQPVISADLLAQLEEATGHAQDVFGDILGSLATTITAATTTTTQCTTHTWHPRPTRPPQGHHHHHHHLSPLERRLVLSRIYGITVELEALFHLLNSPSVVQRTTAAHPVAVINKLLTVRTRGTEIEARLRTMSAHEQMQIASKLDFAQGQLRKLVSDPSELTQYLTKTSGRQLPLTTFLNKMVDNLEPFL